MHAQIRQTKKSRRVLESRSGKKKIHRLDSTREPVDA